MPISESARKFERKLKRAARDIVAASNGKTCGTCKHALYVGLTGFCSWNTNQNGEELSLGRPDAVACRDHAT